MLQATPGFCVFKVARTLLPIAVVAVTVGSAVVAYRAVTTGSTSAGIAGEAKMQMLRDEHALVADYIRMDAEAKRLAYATADKEAAALRVAALEHSRLRLAEAEPVKAAVEPKPVAAKTRSEPVTLAQSAPAAEPLPLAQVTNVNAAVPRRAEGPACANWPPMSGVSRRCCNRLSAGSPKRCRRRSCRRCPLCQGGNSAPLSDIGRRSQLGDIRSEVLA
jgi:hypothetical protein